MTDNRIPVYLQLTEEYIDRYERADYDRQDIQKKSMIVCSLAITLVHEHARAVWQTRGHARWASVIGKLSLG
jgi:hypothetical protein